MMRIFSAFFLLLAMLSPEKTSALTPLGTQHVSGSVMVNQSSQLTVGLAPAQGITAGSNPSRQIMFVLSINETARHDIYTIIPDARNLIVGAMREPVIILTPPTEDTRLHPVVFLNGYNFYSPEYGFIMTGRHEGYQDSIVLDGTQELQQGLYTLGLTVSSWVS